MTEGFSFLCLKSYQYHEVMVNKQNIYFSRKQYMQKQELSFIWTRMSLLSLNMHFHNLLFSFLQYQ